MIWKGVALSLCAAVTHTAIDTLRKSASATLSVSNLVCLVAILDALISCTFVAATGGFQDVTILDPKMFWMAVICSSTLLLLSKCLYQHALATSQLSLTVPYLSFTPTFLVATAYLFIGEEPTPLGLVGVSVVTAGGYLLSRQDQAGGAAGSKSDKDIALGLPTTRQGAHKRQASRDGPGGGSSFASWLGMESSPGPTKHHGDTLASPGENGISAQHGTEKTKHLETRLSSRSLQDLALPQTSLGVANSLNACKALASRPGRSGVAFVAPLELEPVSESSVNVQPVQIDKGSSAGYAMSGGGGPKVHGPGASSVRGWGCLRGWDGGTGIMMCVAGLWSITASLDKLGVMHAPTVWIYFAFQRLAIGVACAVYLLWSSPHAFKLLWTRNLRSLVLISLCETLAVVLFLEAIEYLFVSYVVAIKRCNILMSVVLGGLLWREKIMHRLPYILLMLVGMTLIVLDPDSSTVHTTSHS